MHINPRVTGPHGMAWVMDIDAISKASGNKPHSSLVSWVVSAPEAHPLWHSYVIDLIHLRPVPGLGNPRIYLAGATHELILHAIDPEWRLTTNKRPPILLPANFAAQFIAANDEAAVDKVGMVVVEILAGHLNPDTDATSQWVERFGDNMLRKGMPGDSITQKGGVVLVQGTGAGNLRKLGGDPGNPHTQN